MSSSTESPNSTEGVRTLLIVRHAKSSWETGATNDFERPLNDRGKRDAPMMAQRLLDKNFNPQLLVASPAKRAKKTAELFAEVLGKKEEEIVFVSKLYHAHTEIFEEVVNELEDGFQSVALFSHNPGITHFVNTLVDGIQIDNMPTCGMFAVQGEAARWKDFLKAKKSLVFFDYPKLG